MSLDSWTSLPHAERVALLSEASPEEFAELERLVAAELASWKDLVRPAQRVGDAYITFITGGRRSGKTRAGAEWLAERLAGDGEGDVSAIVAPTFGEGRDKCVEGVSGVLPALKRLEVPVRNWNRSIGELWLESGAKVIVDEAFTGAQKVQGEGLRRAWCDELRNWRARWDVMAWDESLLPAVSAGPGPQIVVTSTLKPKRLVKRLLADPKVDRRHMTIWENAANLAPEFLEEMRARYQGTRLGAQELEGKLLEDVEGALWRADWIDNVDQVAYPGTLYTTVVGMDPADGLQDGDEQGIAVVGLGPERLLYVVASEGLRASPLEFCRRGIGLAREHKATIVVEKNHGGQFLVEVLELAMKEEGVRVPYRTISASQGKRTRAEPVAALYEQGKVRHVGVFPELEEQLTTTEFREGERSPDRLDALVWAVTEVMGYGGPVSEAEGGRVAAWDGRAPRGTDGRVVSWR